MTMFLPSANVHVHNHLELLWFLLHGTPPNDMSSPSTMHRSLAQNESSAMISSPQKVESGSMLSRIPFRWFRWFSGFALRKSAASSSTVSGSPSVSIAGNPNETAIKNKPPPLFALIIGINQYASAVIPALKGAVGDAMSIKAYFEKELGIPSSHIRTLCNEEATRAAIIQQLRDLSTDDRIQLGDPIVIFYAGHGTTSPSPPGWEAGGPEIQMVVPYDCLETVDDNLVYPIPDRTFGALLEKMAKNKGDNLTVIFDCCHSGSGTRDASLDVTGGARQSDRSVRGFKLKVEIPPTLDGEKWGSGHDERGSSIPAGFCHSRLRSHVMLAACSSKETAKEEAMKGRFTTALLEVLSAVGADRLTYTDLIQRIPILPEQNPQCEGFNQDRILFNSKVPSQNRQLFRVQMEDNRFVLRAGSAHGVTPGAVFSVYKDRDSAITDPGAEHSIGSLTASDPDAFSTTMIVTSGTPIFTIGEEAFALQTRAGEEEDLRIHVPFDEKLLCVFQAVAREMKNRTVSQQRIVLVDEVTASLSVAFEDGVIVFNIRDPLATTHGFTQIPFRVKPTEDDVYSVVRAAAHYYWHLHRTSKERTLKDEVTVEAFKLVEISDEYDDDIEGNLLPDGPNCIVDGVADLVADDETAYGLKITNNMDTDLYLSAFFFDNSDFSITPYYQPATSAGRADPSVPAKQALTIGYGDGGVPAFKYYLREGQDLDIGFIKIFLSTEQVDLSHIRQLSPFNPGGRNAGIGKGKPKATWDTILIPVVQRKAK